MPAEKTHPLIERAMTALDRPGLHARALAVRERVAAAVIEDRTHRWIVVGHESEEWATPSVLGATLLPSQARPRPLTTSDAEPLQQRSSAQTGPAHPATDSAGPPELAWCAVAGTAATDTARIVATTPIDQHAAAADDSGLVLLLVQSPWASQPTVDVHLIDGRIVSARY